jgi:hypothetical protein
MPLEVPSAFLRFIIWFRVSRHRRQSKAPALRMAAVKKRRGVLVDRASK